jgi:serine phosphatase RsbU (regulator of sigma subunit)
MRKVGLGNAALILEKTRDYVIETFEGSDEDIKDGMDIALCILDPGTNMVNYAGANISMHYTSQEQLMEVKSNKQPVGKHVIKLPFTNHNVQLTKGDAIYLFTDGMPDQFGGSKGKKFKYKQLRELIQSSQNQSMQQQGQFIDQTFEDWRGNLMQVDDVCIIGIRI